MNQGNNPENKAYHYKKTNGVHARTCQAQPEVHDTPLQSWRGCYFFGLLPEYSKRRAVTRHASAAGRAGRAFRRRLTIAFRPALRFDYPLPDLGGCSPCRLAAGSAALERRPAVPRSGEVFIRARSPTAAPPVDSPAPALADRARSPCRSRFGQRANTALQLGQLARAVAKTQRTDAP